MERIKQIIVFALIASGVLFWALILIIIGNNLPSEKIYDCSLAEISPDFPREVVNECRRIRSGKSIST